MRRIGTHLERVETYCRNGLFSVINGNKSDETEKKKKSFLHRHTIFKKSVRNTSNYYYSISILLFKI